MGWLADINNATMTHWYWFYCIKVCVSLEREL